MVVILSLIPIIVLMPMSIKKSLIKIVSTPII